MAAQISILVIEDEKHICDIIKYNLEMESFTVQLAQDGIEGIKMAHENPKLKVILLDWMMPGMSGIEVLSAIRADEEIKKIPVIMLTVKGTIGDIEDAFEAKVDGYITKPFDPELLGEMIRDKLRTCMHNRRKYRKEEKERARDKPRKKNVANLVK